MHEIASFIDAINLQQWRLKRPHRFVFLCGGKLNEGAETPCSVREHFLRRCHTRKELAAGIPIVLAEDVNQSFSPAKFNDLLELEKYVASLSEVNILILESAGSIAELGAFSQSSEIASRLFVAVKDDRHPVDSFISNGPLLFLEKSFGEEVVSNYPFISEGETLRASSPVVGDLYQDVFGIVSSRSIEEKFKPRSKSHIMNLIAQLAYLFYGVTIIEMQSYLNRLDIDLDDREMRLMFHALQLVGWIQRRKYKQFYYYVATKGFSPSAVAYKPKKKNDTLRWRFDIFQELKKKNDFRVDVFRRSLGEAADEVAA
ncbi:retron St85 family effector protein [Salinarimonas ramus]|uniref:retron St85 family effector protein n=1 Tax=Salinarimonas ramus TaxID=690164 RepID=UPI00166B1607|nr:retron St85 family effector protein [Salinarimonas ramus]